MPSTSFGGVAGGGNNPPSTPTDSLSSTFALGVSNSPRGEQRDSYPSPAQLPRELQRGQLPAGVHKQRRLREHPRLRPGMVRTGPASTPTDTRSNTFTLGALEFGNGRRRGAFAGAEQIRLELRLDQLRAFNSRPRSPQGIPLSSASPGPPTAPRPLRGHLGRHVRAGCFKLRGGAGS